MSKQHSQLSSQRKQQQRVARLLSHMSQHHAITLLLHTVTLLSSPHGEICVGV